MSLDVVAELSDRCSVGVGVSPGQRLDDLRAELSEHVPIGRVDAEVPPVPGELCLDLTLTAGDITATNRYTTRITP